jgi:hypothetical protein
MILSAVCTADPKSRWLSDPINPINLKSGVLYPFVVPDRRADDLKWKTAVSPLAPIPSSALLPDYSSEGTRQAFVELYKAAIVVNGFNLSADEASYLQSHNKDKNDFEGFDFNAVTLQCWKRLQAYTDLRNNLPRTDTRLIDLFQWANHPDGKTTLSAKIAAATTWKQDNIRMRHKNLQAAHQQRGHAEQIDPMGQASNASMPVDEQPARALHWLP